MTNLQYNPATGHLWYKGAHLLDELTDDCTADCPDCAAGTLHRKYQITFNGGWSNGAGCATCAADFNGVTVTVTNDVACDWLYSPGIFLNCISSFVPVGLQIITDGAGGLNITVTFAGLNYTFHQAGSNDCSGPWTVTSPGGSGVSGSCTLAAGSTATVVAI